MTSSSATDTDQTAVLRPHAVTAVQQAQAQRPHNFRLWAVKLLRDATSCGLRDGVEAVDWATDYLKTASLEQHRLPALFGWSYRFPNGHDVTVIDDPSRPFRFEMCSAALNVGGDVVGGLTSEQVEAKLHEIAALPTR